MTRQRLPLTADAECKECGGNGYVAVKEFSEIYGALTMLITCPCVTAKPAAELGKEEGES